MPRRRLKRKKPEPAMEEPFENAEEFIDERFPVDDPMRSLMFAFLQILQENSENVEDLESYLRRHREFALLIRQMIPVPLINLTDEEDSEDNSILDPIPGLSPEATPPVAPRTPTRATKEDLAVPPAPRKRKKKTELDGSAAKRRLVFEEEPAWPNEILEEARSSLIFSEA